MILATKLNKGKNKELLQEMKAKCFPDILVRYGVPPAELKVLQSIIYISDIPIELLAQSYYEYIDIGLNPATTDELRKAILHEDDYSRYFENYTGLDIEDAIYTFELRRKNIIEQVMAGTY